MRAAFLLILSVALGIGMGAGAAIWQVGGTDQSSAFVQHPDAPDTNPQGTGQAKVFVDNDTHDFGAMEHGSTGTHDFIFTNTGDGPLRLSVGETTCQCTVGAVTGDEIPPGATVPVTLEWTIKTHSSEFRHSATILTNDPFRREVELTVSGNVRQAVMVFPRALSLGSVRRGTAQSTFVDVVSFKQPDLKIENYQWDGVGIEDYLEVSFAPLAEEQIPDPAALAAIRVTVAMRAGAPTGAIRGWLQLDTNLQPEPRVEVPLSGKVVSDISLSGPGYSSQRDLLTLGAVDRNEGKQIRLVAFVRGEHAQATEMEVERTVPEYLEARVGEVAIRTERVTQFPIEIKVPAGTRPGKFLGEGDGGFGKIILKTTHPDIPRLEINVRFTVGE